MSTHLDPGRGDDAVTAPVDVGPRHRDPVRAGVSPVVTVVLAAIAAVVLVVAMLVLAGHAEGAAGLATLSMLLGVGMAIGFRKQWTR